jgi:apolipoprotein D and lipocalin family protein
MKTAAFLLFTIGLTGLYAKNAGIQPVRTVDKVDLDRYMGKWFEIAAFPQRFEKGCHCTTAEYEMTDKGYVRVFNTCRKAFVVKGSGNAKLRVQFFWPFRGNYWIIDLAEDYTFAVVGDPSRKYLWILSRTPEMDPVLYDEIVRRTEAQGFDTTKLVKADQSCL